MPQGIANDDGTPWWEINDVGGAQLARFDHRLFPNIRNGAAVTYIDADGDGVAESVQPATTVTRYMDRASATGPLSEVIEARVFETIMAELAAASGETAENRQRRLRRLRAVLDSRDF